MRAGEYTQLQQQFSERGYPNARAEQTQTWDVVPSQTDVLLLCGIYTSSTYGGARRSRSTAYAYSSPSVQPS